MEAIARLGASDRRDLFAAVASEPRGALPRPVGIEIIEKDAWVCFALQRIFKLSLLRGDGREPPVVFKGGTSLSKGYGLIRRFSEDIDLTLKPALFGVDLESPPASKKEHKRRLDGASAKCGEYVSGPLRDALDRDLSTILGGSGWVVPAPEDPSTLLFAYPGPSGPAGSYVPPTVRMEFGCRSDREPWEARPIIAYAALARPAARLGEAFDVPVLVAKRTFLEKATLLHAENSRARKLAAGAPSPWAHYSRHASDLGTMARTEVATAAIGDEGLLRRVCENKESRWHASYVTYTDIRYDNIEVVPRGQLAIQLERDYAAMRGMFFEDPPPWGAVMEELTALEKRMRAANSLRTGDGGHPPATAGPRS